MRGFRLFIILLIIGFSACVRRQEPSLRPKIVIGLVIDQMRWDYLYRYADLYGNDGFKRLLRDGFSCQNTSINYLPSYTAPGHACVYTGSVPSINGITGNNWIDNQTCSGQYCVDDNSVHLAEDSSMAPSMSPNALFTTTITDELRLATNFRSRVYGVAIKDRGSILPAGHLANAAYWYNDKTGNFTTSTYYKAEYQNPSWLKTFNKRRAGDSFVKQGWELLYPPVKQQLYAPGKYAQSTTDTNAYEKAFKGEKAPVFPHRFDSLKGNDRYAVLKSIPAGNAYSIMMAKACIEGEDLGNNKNKETDFLALSLSATDYIGHQFGPNSMEIEDCYLRLDKEIAAFLKYLDHRFGKNNYLFFLTADHGAAHNVTFLSERHVPSGIFSAKTGTELNSYLKGLFGKDSIVRGIENYQVFLNESMFGTPVAADGEADNKVTYKKVRVKTGHGRHARYKIVSVRVGSPKPKMVTLDRAQVKHAVIEWLSRMPEISYVIDMEDMNKTPIPEPIRTMAINGYNKIRSGPIEIILNPGWYEGDGKTTGTTHGTWNPYDTHIPLIWYGWHVPKGESNAALNMTDISATLAAMLHIQAPNGCIGKPILEITDKKKKD
jgi:arylsulfatase A-like enzyme